MFVIIGSGDETAGGDVRGIFIPPVVFQTGPKPPRGMYHSMCTEINLKNSEWYLYPLTRNIFDVSPALHGTFTKLRNFTKKVRKKRNHRKIRLSGPCCTTRNTHFHQVGEDLGDRQLR